MAIIVIVYGASSNISIWLRLRKIRHNHWRINIQFRSRFLNTFSQVRQLFYALAMQIADGHEILSSCAALLPDKKAMNQFNGCAFLKNSGLDHAVILTTCQRNRFGWLSVTLGTAPVYPVHDAANQLNMFVGWNDVLFLHAVVHID